MPRKPTIHAIKAEKELRCLAARSNPRHLPTVRELGERYEISHVTVFRILQRLRQEAVVWQHPNGRFYPSSAERKITGGFPIVMIGRQIQNWSILYREILEGVSEVCTARGCPLVFLSSTQLLRHDKPEQPPVFGTPSQQKTDLARLLAALPRPCGGIILDHLWDDKLAASVTAAFRNSAMLLRTCGTLDSNRGSIDLFGGAEIILDHLSNQGYRHLVVAIPFAGDPAIQAACAAVQEAAKLHPFAFVRTVDCSTAEKRRKFVLCLKRPRERVAIVSLEDHIATLLWREFQSVRVDSPATVGLVSLQGTSAVVSPLTRLRYDYRLLGRELVSSLLAGKFAWKQPRAALVRGRTASSH